MDRNDEKSIETLYKAFTLISDEAECKKFFSDLCTPVELLEMAGRLKTAIMLSQGQSYNEVIKATGMSSATISRVNKCLETGSGYLAVIKKLGGEN
ncbi:MAG: TrpR-like protein [Clostridia bacterium]|nr:TrpR-like protein [Clostridia bacterium]